MLNSSEVNNWIGILTVNFENTLEKLDWQLIAIGIGHSWSWARFMATQILAINFAKNKAIYSV